MVVVLLTVAAAGAVQTAARIEPIRNDRLYEFPLSIEGWKGTVIPMDQWVYESLETDFGILRDYRNTSGDTINIAVVWYDDREIAFHAVESCLGAAGDQVKVKETQTLSLSEEKRIEIGKLIVNRHGSQYLVLYFYGSGQYTSPSQGKVRRHVVIKRLGLQRASASLVRIMTEINGNMEEAQAALEDFMRKSYPLILDYTNIPEHVSAK